MKKAVFYHFLPSKTEEEEHTRSAGALRWEMAELRAEPPQLHHFFPWEINKVLTLTDVGHFGSLELSPDQVHRYIFKHWDDQTVARVLDRGEQIPIVISDLDTGTDHRLFFKKWPSDENFSIYSCWIREFVGRRGLKAGMLIGMYWDVRSSAFRFSVLKRLED